MGSHSVIKKFKGKISGSGNMYDNLEKDRNRMEHEIEQCKDKIKISKSIYKTIMKNRGGAAVSS